MPAALLLLGAGSSAGSPIAASIPRIAGPLLERKQVAECQTSRQRKFTEFSTSATKHSQGRGIEDGKIVSRSILLEVSGV